MHHGQGLGNQLFCYITARTIAADKGVDFGLKGLENLINSRDRLFGIDSTYLVIYLDNSSKTDPDIRVTNSRIREACHEQLLNICHAFTNFTLKPGVESCC